jgi:hypothetical protein
MHDPNWLDELGSELRKAKLPLPYIGRLMDELSDHLEDVLKEHDMSKDAQIAPTIAGRMGSATDVASSAAAEFRQASFWRRHPRLAFIGLPILVMPILWIPGMASVDLIAAAQNSWDFNGIWPGRLSPDVLALMRVCCVATTLLPALLAGLLFAWLGARTGMATRWPLIACAIVGLMSALTRVGFLMTPLPDTHAWQTVEFGHSIGDLYALTGVEFFQPLVKVAVPLVVCAWILRRHRLRQELAL